MDALPEDTSLHGGAPELRYTYLPLSHRKALQPNNMLLMGIRGSGKSFWWAALQMPAHRDAVGKNFGLDKETVVSKGFGEKPAPDDNPGKDTLSGLLSSFDARLIWRTVVFKHVCRSTAPKEFSSLRRWEQRVKWLKTKGLDWQQDYINRLNPDLPFQHYLIKYLPEGPEVSILDVRSRSINIFRQEIARL